MATAFEQRKYSNVRVTAKKPIGSGLERADDSEWCVKIKYKVVTQDITSSQFITVERANRFSFKNWMEFINGSESLLAEDGIWVCDRSGEHYFFNTNVSGIPHHDGDKVPMDILREPLREVIEQVYYSLGFQFREE